MINQNIKIEKREGQDYAPIPSNIYQAQLLDIIIEEKPKYKQPNEKENLLSFQFTLLAGKDKDGSELRGRNLWRNYVPVYLYIGKKGKNVLYQIIEAIKGRELTQEEEATMDTDQLNDFIGKQLRVFTENITKDDKTYSNIKSFLPKETDYPALTEEEKENARVKNKKEAVEERPELTKEDYQDVEGGGMTIDLTGIPF